MSDEVNTTESGSTFDQIKVIIVKKLYFKGDDVERVTREASLMDDLEADSLDLADIMMAIEEHFEIDITDEDAEAAQNIGDIVDAVDRYLKAK